MEAILFFALFHIQKTWSLSKVIFFSYFQFLLQYDSTGNKFCFPALPEEISNNMWDDKKLALDYEGHVYVILC